MNALVLALVAAATFELPATLAELSDLCAADAQSLWAVDDERGALFRLAARDGAVLETVPFAEAGDFEAVAAVGDTVFVGRSDGALFAVDLKTRRAQQLEAALPRDCELEGLAYERPRNRLLATCKRPSGAKAQRAWSIWAIDLATRTLSASPVISIRREAIQAFRKQHAGKKLKDADDDLDPSGLAVHPTTGELYVISARARVLLVISPTGELLGLEALDADRWPQPEAIAFLPDGTLFIGTEARRGKPARIHTLERLKSPSPSQ